MFKFLFKKKNKIIDDKVLNRIISITKELIESTNDDNKKLEYVLLGYYCYCCIKR